MNKYISGVREFISRAKTTILLLKRTKSRSDSFLTQPTVFKSTIPEGYLPDNGFSNWLVDLSNGRFERRN